MSAWFSHRFSRASAWAATGRTPVVQHLGEAANSSSLGRFAPSTFWKRLIQAVLFVGLFVARDRENAPVGRQLAVAEGLEQCGYQLA